MKVELLWATPNADAEIGYIARVSDPKATIDDPNEKLIKYLIDHEHWSPFEMACACVEIRTTRDIARQILRHRAFHFQEFSQRYAEILPDPVFREARLQDKQNRQNSLYTGNEEVHKLWLDDQAEIWRDAHSVYMAALEMGIAKEVARAVLPEGLTPTHLYMQGTIRDWLHYIHIRSGPETQLEHRLIAQRIGVVLAGVCPNVFNAAQQAGVIGDVNNP